MSSGINRADLGHPGGGRICGLPAGGDVILLIG